MSRPRDATPGVFLAGLVGKDCSFALVVALVRWLVSRPTELASVGWECVVVALVLRCAHEAFRKDLLENRFKRFAQGRETCGEGSGSYFSDRVDGEIDRCVRGIAGVVERAYFVELEGGYHSSAALQLDCIPPWIVC